MKINGAPYVVDLSQSAPVRKERALDQAARSESSAKVRILDRVEISPRSREMARLKREVEAMPEVRLERVALARQNLQQGEYRVEASVLAQKMLEAYDRR